MADSGVAQAIPAGAGLRPVGRGLLAVRDYSACIEMLFADETDDDARRIELAHLAGVPLVEFWRWSNKDLGAIAAVCARTGVGVAAMLAEPMIGLNDPANAEAFVTGVVRSAAIADRLGARVLIAQVGATRDGVDAGEQTRAIVECLTAVGQALAGGAVRLGIEPLNTRIDHRGYFLDSTAAALDLLDAVDSPHVGIVFDLYHSGVMGESVDVLSGRMGRVLHVHVADHPGRHEPGTGGLDLRRSLDWIFAEGYGGAVGLEFRPQRRSAEAIGVAMTALG